MIVHVERRSRLSRAVRQAAVALVLLGAVAGCELVLGEGPGAPSSDPSSGPGPKKPSPMDRPGAIVPAAPDRPQSQDTPEPKTTPPATAALPPEPRINSDPERLLGMEPEAVTELLGSPAFVRTDSPSLLWRYRGPHCLLDLFLYKPPDAASRQNRVLYYTVQANGGPEPSARKCLDSLLRARMHKATG